MRIPFREIGKDVAYLLYDRLSAKYNRYANMYQKVKKKERKEGKEGKRENNGRK
jgi:hypothetical protein